jgi:hypothetical protein
MKTFKIASALLLALSMFACTETDITPVNSGERVTTAPATTTPDPKTPATVPTEDDDDTSPKNKIRPLPSPIAPNPTPVKPVTVENP